MKTEDIIDEFLFLKEFEYDEFIYFLNDISSSTIDINDDVGQDVTLDNLNIGLEV